MACQLHERLYCSSCSSYLFSRCSSICNSLSRPCSVTPQKARVMHTDSTSCVLSSVQFSSVQFSSVQFSSGTPYSANASESTTSCALYTAGQQSVWEAEAAQLRKQLLADALAVSQRRQAAAGQLRLSVERCLRDLAMGGSRFDVRISWEPVPQPQVSRGLIDDVLEGDMLNGITSILCAGRQVMVVANVFQVLVVGGVTASASHQHVMHQCA